MKPERRAQVLTPDLAAQNGFMVDELRHKAEQHITLFSSKVDELIGRYHLSPQIIEGMLRENNIPGYLIAVPVWAVEQEIRKDHKGIKISSRLPYDSDKKLPFVTLYFIDKQQADDKLGLMRATPEQNFQMLGRAGLRLITFVKQ